MLTTTQAAAELGITPSRLRVLIRSKRIPAQETMSGYRIDPRDLKAIAERPTGRPRKAVANV